MGLGKTLQALIGVALAHNDSATNDDDTPNVSSLVVCPSTLVGHWIGEIEKYFPGRSVFKLLCFAGSRSERRALWSSTSAFANIVVTSYAILRSDIELLASKTWCYCILDEGHLLKNPKTGKAICYRTKIMLLFKRLLIISVTLIDCSDCSCFKTYTR